MSDADDAYAAAEAEVARVKAAGETVLEFNQPQFHALTALPTPIAGLTALGTLRLQGSAVSDLRPIDTLTGWEQALLVDSTSRTPPSSTPPTKPAASSP